ncbi:alpha/beta hydrolase [Tersicoccus sp. MR15.9]|uniref:alpha/beta fold hydrolase n=1 Tax=Tersicoccus mangrovi TaxID=3121635 RepID=UPI002FE53853
MSTTTTLHVDGLGAVPLTYTRYGDGTHKPVLLLHGGGGPGTVNPWGEKIAAELPAEVVAPVHPGFDFTERPEVVDSIAAVARVEAALLDELNLTGVTVVGNSIGGWVAIELALLASPRVTRLILVDSVGIEVDGHPIPDFFEMSPADLAAATFADPATHGIDFSTLPEPVRRRMASNRASLDLYAGRTMADPGLKARLDGITVPTLVVWGEADGMGDLDYGRALAATIPDARFQVIEHAGHLPQVEQPAALTALVAGALTD